MGGRGGYYNWAVMKRHCIQRADWRLTPGKDAARLSEHYKLDCDFGTAVIEIYKAGEGSDPVYLCANHVAEVGPVKKRSSEVRLVAADLTPAAAEPMASLSAVHATSHALAHGPSIIREASAAANMAASKPSAAIAPFAPGAAKSASNVVTMKAVRAETSRPPARDLTYGNSTKALVDEAIWNLATGNYEAYASALRQGKSVSEAAQAAGGQLEIVHRRIGEYSLKIEVVLSGSTAKINVEDVIHKPFESAMAEIIGNAAMGDAEKDAALEQLGTLQQCINRGLDREISPLRAHQIACAIAERANWGANASLAEELKPAYRAVYGSVRSAVRAAVPHAHSLEERLTNLYAAKSDLENAPAAKALYAQSN
jgi:hypothetical protein